MCNIDTILPFAANDAALAHPGIPDTRDGRVSFLLNDLLMRSQWVTIEEYADLLYVSARTLSNDMRLVEQKLAQFDLTLEKRPRYGIRVAGGESQRRLCLASLVRPVLPDTDDASVWDAPSQPLGSHWGQT